MKTRIIFICLLVIYCLPSMGRQAGQVVMLNEVKQAFFAEDVIMIELTHELSHSVRREREKCLFGCTAAGTLEIAIGSIGVNRSDAAKTALLNLLGVRLDGAASEELNCQILIRGHTLLRHLERLRPKDVAERCQSNFLRLRKRELSKISDVKIEQLCHSEDEIRRAQDEILKAVKSKVMCE